MQLGNTMNVVLRLTVILTLMHAAPTQSENEPCRSSLRNVTSCNNAVDVALGDDRIAGEKPNQCRVGCKYFTHPDIAMSIRSANCSFDLCDVPLPFRTFTFGTRMCQPRALCISSCGEEPPGCVYSGTCREFTCFHDKNTGLPASFTRLTFAGPRSIVRVNESVTSDTPSTYGPVDAVLISGDRCSDDNRPRTYGHCAESTNVFLSDQGDDDEEFVQCRRACRNIRNEEVEIVRMRTNCKSCSSLSPPYLCIAQSECRDRCNAPLVEGCVFTGSCKSLVCVSGIDSKLPAVVNVSDETGKGGIIVSVDNARLTASIDPPVFVKYLENRRVPNASIPVTVTGDSHVPLVQNVDISDSENASTNTNNSASSPTKSQDEQVSKWLWLGPTIGLFGALITALAAIVAAYIARNGITNRTRNKKPIDIYDDYHDLQ